MNAMGNAQLKLIASTDAPDPDARLERLSQRLRAKTPTQGRIARRRWRVLFAKRVLPVVALALLTTVALWPELSSDAMRARIGFRLGSLDPESGQLTHARYNGVDEHGRPYTITAETARQSNPERIDLTAPIGDMTLANGTWMRAQSRAGVYMQRSGQLDMSGEVTLYRDDGVTLRTDAASLEVKSGAAASSAMTHMEGPFGTLDAQGFAMLDRGAVIQFSGPGRLILNGAGK